MVPRTASPQFSTAEFDCELPDDALDELLMPKRANMLGRPSNASDKRRAIILAVLMLVLVAAGVMIALVSRQRPSVMPAAVPAASIELIQPPAAVLTPEVRRAEPVPVTVKRAEQVLRLGRWNQVWMPDGQLTWIRFRGVRETFEVLPSNPEIGDAYGVNIGQHALWVWHQLPGHTLPAWVDP
jgi:hypothetical protein